MTSPPSVPATTAAGRGRPGRRRRIRTIAEVVCCQALGAVCWIVLWGIRLEERGGHLGDLDIAIGFLDLLLGFGLSIAIPVLHRRPRATLALLLLSALSAWGLPACLIALHRIGAFRRLRWDVLAVASVMTGATLSAVLDSNGTFGRSSEDLVAVIGVLLLVLLVLAWGRARGQQYARYDLMRERAESADRQRLADLARHDAELRTVRAEERTAIARDMHDTISHQLALVSMHAGALARREDLGSTNYRRSAETVRQAAQAAGRGLREVLVALRTDDDRRPLVAAQTVEQQVARAREEGDAIELRWTGEEPHHLFARSTAAALALGRITGELLANARLHAPGQTVVLTVSLTAEQVELVAENQLVDGERSLVGTGTGLVGAGERARLHGGELRSGRADGRFQVVVRLPITASESTGAETEVPADGRG